MQCIKITHTNKNITIRVIKNTIKVREGRIMLKKIEVDRKHSDLLKSCKKHKNYIM